MFGIFIVVALLLRLVLVVVLIVFEGIVDSAVNLTVDIALHSILRRIASRANEPVEELCIDRHKEHRRYDSQSNESKMFHKGIYV